MDLISEFLYRNSQKRLSIHVIGDCMVDEYYNVKVTRISPESPNVNVMLSEKEFPGKTLPGGAANVAYQLKQFNCEETLAGFIDNNTMVRYEACGLNNVLGVTAPRLLNPLKKRYYDGAVQVGNRLDIEKPSYGLGDRLTQAQNALFDLYIAKTTYPDVVILSDYDKGIFQGSSTCFNYCFNYCCPVIVDPKKAPLSKWAGCTIFKPNSDEAQSLSQLSDWKDQSNYFMDQLGCSAVVITQKGCGVVGKTSNGYFEHKSTRCITAYDPIGGGDCFVAVLALAVGHGFSVEQAAIIAFETGAVYVQDRDNFNLWKLQRRSKFISPAELKDRNFKLVIANGCFDIMHSGHLETLRIAKSKGDKLLVAVNSDESVERLKGPKRPVVPLKERMEMLAALECVDYVISFDENTPLKLIEEIKPEVLIKGADWLGKTVAGADIVNEIHYVPVVEDLSTTNLIEKIKRLS